MKRIGCTAATLLLASISLAPGSAVAQGDPDLREILPYLMLVIDTSGSMERLPACTCESPSCEECLPKCHLPNVDGQPPTEPPNDPDGRQLKKNRWATTLEALTGTFNDFQCEMLPRTTANGATFDLNYFTPHHQPWDCTTADTACPFSSVPATYQNGNGILDQYATRVRFGLMTFDGWDTYVGAIENPMPASNFDIPRSNSVHGLWSYGGPKRINYPGCAFDYMMDTGARSAIAAEGALISMNSCQGGGTPGGSETCASWCSSCDGNQTNINIDIQEALLGARPYGGTPIAASLDDLYYHLKNDVSDAFGGCRNRFALLVTDGQPDADYYDLGCDCKNQGDQMDPYRCCPGGTPCDPDDSRYHPDLKWCPYPRSEAAARDLVLGRTGDPPMIERL
jgi:type IV pilus assembly protein PilY1